MNSESSSMQNMRERNVVVWYTTSLYGSSKSSSQYDQLDRYMKFIGNTEGKDTSKNETTTLREHHQLVR